MIGRAHGLALSLLIGLAAAAGALAVVRSTQLRSATKPELATRAAIDARSRRLDAWARSLDRTLRARPPRLPAVPRYASIQVVTPPPEVALPALPARPAAPAVRTRLVRAAAPRTAAPAGAAPSQGGTAAAPRSPEQQCEALKQAAETQGEAAKQAAERQCEALKQGGDD